MRIRSAYLNWVESKDINDLHEVEHYIQLLAPEYSNDKEVLNFKAITAFVLKKDVKEAIELIRITNDRNQPHWHLNFAFLLAYNGDLKNAIRHYRIASRLPDIPPVVLSQIEDFIVWSIKNEPERSQLYYILGFFNWKIKGDLLRATKDIFNVP
jgi:hypothetical protein